MDYQKSNIMNLSQSLFSWSNRSTKLVEKLAVIGIKLKRRIIWELKRLASVPAQITGYVSNLSFIEENILYPQYLKALREHESALPALNSMDSKIVDELVRSGICMTSLESLAIPNTGNIFKAATKIKEGLKEIASLPINQNNSTIYATADLLMSYPELFYWGLDERLLKIAERYLGMPVAYDGILFTLSIADGTEYGVRDWHKDVEDRRMMRVCIYLNDVDENGGPFQFMQSDTNLQIGNLEQDKDTCLYDKTTKKLSYLSPSDCIRTCTGPAGTVIFADTARHYHRGKPPTQSHRFAIFFSYFSRRPLHPYFCHRSVLSGKYLHRLTESLCAEQRACVLWAENLPNLVKWIPKKLT
jgi:hypothetical protein